MKLCALLLLIACAAPVQAMPVHVALKSAVSVSPNADGFFTLGSVADVTGGAAIARLRLSGVPVGRAPLSGETRRVTRGDVALKMRQAGWDPDRQAVLEGAGQADVTTVGALLAAPSSAALPESPLPGAAAEKGAASSAPTPQQSANPILHRGDAVTIVIRSGSLTITALGTAREGGGVGDTVRVHREGLMTDLSVRVLDAKTVQLEI